jgi:hypothetical protein
MVVEVLRRSDAAAGNQRKVTRSYSNAEESAFSYAGARDDEQNQ